MPKYLYHGSYTQEGVKGLLKEGGSSRRVAIQALIEGMGGSVESFYFALGKDDLYVIVDLPDQTTATALSLAVAASGAIQLTTVALITPEELDEAAKMTVDYRPPGQ